MFTDKYLKGVKPKSSAYRVFEKGIDKGFGIKITPAGSISFFLQYSSKGAPRFMNLGRYPSVSLSEAREKCRLARGQIDNGIDPQDSAKQIPVRGSVAELFEYYISTMKQDGKRTWQHVKSSLEFNCSEILHLPASEVEPSHIRQILYDVIQRGSETQANRIRSYLHRAFVVGLYHDNDPKSLGSGFSFNIAVNPVAAVPKNTAAERVGERVLSFEELAVLWNTPNLSPQFRLAARLLVFYGCRSSELLWAKWDEFDFGALVWSLQPGRVKNDRWHLLPITPHSATWLDELRVYARDSDYLFPGRDGDDKPVGKGSFAQACRCVSGIAPFCPRDLRRTTKTRMGEIGIDKIIRDRIQNHAAQDVSAKHYDRYDYLSEKRAALEVWGGRLMLLGK